MINQGLLPTFSNIIPAEIEPTLKQIIEQNQQQLQAILAQKPHFSWQNLFVPLQEMDNRLNKMWSPVAHLYAVQESEALRSAYNACLPLLTDYHTSLLQNEELYAAIQALAASPEAHTWSAAQHKVINNELRDFRLAGVGLPPADKAQLADLQKQLSGLTTQFAENLLDASHAWSLHTTNPEDLEGLPEQALQAAAQAAQQQNKTGWLFTLDYPSYSSVIKYLARRELRYQMYAAYVTRASDQGPNAGQWDNTNLMEDILKVRQEIAQLLNFPHFAAYSLATKMADTPERVLQFLNDLVARAEPFAKQEMHELEVYAKSLDNIDQLQAWDVAFYTEKLRQAKYAISTEELRQYFPANKALSGMFEVMQRLLGIRMVEQFDADVWHPDVQFFAIYDAANQLRGYFYTDLYARPHKRDGAWMDEARVRQRLPDNTIQLPVAFLTCNFAPPLGDKPALLTHDDVQTLFHEFGHCLHHLLTQVDYAPIAGINGVPWDAVEFPSQFFEYWCWDKEALQLISAHVITGAPVPDALYDKLIANKNFQAGMHMLRQLEFALFDFRLHMEFVPGAQSLQVPAILADIRSKISVLAVPVFNRFQHSFSHIFAGGYAAGYYSYKWAEVLSSDAFSRFEEQGVFDRESGQAFLTHILAQGGAKSPMDLFVAFRGREPRIDALLKYSGL